MKVGLFIPCYINALYPEVGEASYKLLTQLGVEVDYPLDQTCCGQPMANAGYERDAKALAERMESPNTTTWWGLRPVAWSSSRRDTPAC